MCKFATMLQMNRLNAKLLVYLSWSSSVVASPLAERFPCERKKGGWGLT